MGNSESNCCDILKEDTSTANSTSNKNCQDSNVEDHTINDEREISLKSKSLKSSQDGKTNQTEQEEYILDDTHTLASTVIEDSNINNDAPTSLETDELLRTPRIKAVKECLFDPRSPSSGINRTPCGVMYISNSDVNVDPRSPSTGVDRTPIVFKDKPEELPIADPRSPSVGIDRTPIVMEKLEESSSSGMKVSEDQKDPRSPMAEVSRTPIRTLYNSSNLRRTVLLSNTLMSSPCTGAASVEKTNQDDIPDHQNIQDNQDIPAINIEESSPTSNEKITITQNTLLNLSSASNLNESLSSSMVAVLGSDSRSVNFDELSDAEANSCNVSIDEYYDLCGEVKEVVNDMVLEACIDAKSLDERITEKAQLVTDSGLESPKEVQEETEHDTLTSKIREETEEAEIEIL
uniref:Uncharacterized protein n=1 Tax=Ciona savignyi TaxID=51511 RepID=H2YY73_CIOSA